MLPLIQRRAGFSRCRLYRYWLYREFAQGSGHCVFIGLNPSTGDANSDDPTIRRCMGFASDWGYRRMTVVNLFGFRTPDPSALKSVSIPEGPGNRAALRKACNEADNIVAAWGAHGTYLSQSRKLASAWAAHTLYCFGQTKNQQPLHPLYLPKTASLKPYLPQY
ncbi:MAG: DUF1643 domain-containing protein [Granulosicoccus sp.]